MRRQRHEDGVDRNQKVGVKSIELRIWEYDPIATQVDARLLRFGEDGEHVHVPLSEFVDPVRDVGKRLRVHNDVVEPFLTIKNMNNESRLMEPIGKRHEKQHGQNGRPDELQKVEVGPRVLIFVVHFFVPASVGHVEGGLLTDKVLEKERRLKRVRLTCGKESERRCRLYIYREQ